jgi:endo-1,4-beta-xylanase
MTGPTRRDVLMGAAAGALHSFTGDAALAADVPSLRVLGAAKGITVGTAYSGTNDEVIRGLVRDHAAIVTPEWCLKPGFLKPDWDRPARFAEADATYDFATAAGLAVHGHTLFWDGHRVAWIDGLGRDSAEKRYGAFVDEVVGRYPDLPSWDVVNEIVADPPKPDLIKSDAVLGTLGLDFVVFLFRRARAAAPNAALCLNDYNLECAQYWCTDKKAKTLALLDRLLGLGAPIDAVGIQSHLSSRHGLGIEDTLAFCDKLAERGLDVYLSELDVNDVTLPDSIPERDLAVADLYRTYLDALLSHRAVKRMVLWGLSDRDHYLVRENVDDARPSGRSRPGLFDAEGRPKAAFFAVAEALRAAPVR